MKNIVTRQQRVKGCPILNDIVAEEGPKCELCASAQHPDAKTPCTWCQLNVHEETCSRKF